MRLPMILPPLAFAAMSVAAGANDAPPAGPAAIPSTDLATVATRGAQLYAFDQAAWHTTDAMLAAKLPRETIAAIEGWAVEQHGDGLTVTYYGMAQGKPFAIYIADFKAGAVSNGRVPGATERALSPLGQRIAAAHEVAFAQPFPVCAPRPFNAVILPPDAQDVMPVYLLTPMTENGTYPFGGHHEVAVAADGTIFGMRDFSKACLPMKAPVLPRGAKPMGLFINHLLDPHPTEIHVYLSLWSGMPVFVRTGQHVWEIAGTHIRQAGIAK